MEQALTQAEPAAPRGVAGVAAADPGRVAIVTEGRRLTFGALDRAANALAHTLSEAGVGPGDRVALVMGNRPEFFSVWNAAARLGALVVPVSTRLTAPEVAYIVSDSASRVVVHDPGAAADASRQAAAEAQVPALCVDDPGFDDGRDEPPRLDYIGSAATTMTYTSGTTGRPKGIARPAPVPATTTAPSPFASFWGFGPDDVHLMCGPAYHTAPSAYAQMSLVEGGTVVMMARFDGAECLRLIQDERVTTSQMVPAHFIRILEADWQRYDRSSMRRILHAAAPCPISVKRRIIEVFPPGTVWEFYGASEGMASVVSPEEWLAKPGTVGKPFPGLSVKILDDDGKELPTGEVGALYISSFTGLRFEYHNAPEKTEAAWDGDYFTVGDLGWVDEDGYVFLADRRTDLILSGGVNVYPAEVETALIEDDDVVDAAVFGLPDARMGQRVHAVVELRPGVPRDAGALLARLAMRLADFKRPRTIEFVDELPREPNGKVLKARMREERARAEEGAT
jgi:long-chain acyl-CoA synthetase